MVSSRMAVQHVIQITPLLMRAVTRELRCHSAGVDPSHFRLLSMLSRQTCSLSELAERSGVSLATMSRTVATLVERGWIDRRPDTTDRRFVRVTITPRGCEIAQQVNARLEGEIERLLAELTPEDLQKVEDGAALLLRTLLKSYHPEESVAWIMPVECTEDATPLNEVEIERNS